MQRGRGQEVCSTSDAVQRILLLILWLSECPECALDTEVIVRINRSRLVDFALQLVGQDSVSGQEGAVARRTLAEMRELGLTASTDDWGNVVGVWHGGPGPIVLLDAHMDTIPIGDLDRWHHHARGELSGGRLYGRGAVDMKGALASMIYGAGSLIGENPPLSGTVVVCASVIEEWVEGPALVHVCKQTHPDYVIIGEATDLMLAIAQKGRAEIQVDIHGESAHSSRPHLGINAAEHMVDVIQAFRDWRPPVHPHLGAGLLVLTDLHSFPSPALSTIPSRCQATFDRRSLPGEQAEVLLPLQTIVANRLEGTNARSSVQIACEELSTYTGAVVTTRKLASAWEADADAPFVQQALHALGGTGLDAQVSTYSFCTNGSGSAGVLHLPTLGFGPGNPNQAHQVDESLPIDDLVKAARGYAAIIRELMQMN